MMPSLTCFNIRFTPHWLMSICASCFILLFLRLGFWQLERADEKIKMVTAEKALAKQEPVKWNAGQKFPGQYQRIRVEGNYLSKVFLLDNQHYKHQFGYEVLSPLLLEDDSVVMIDRGWVPGASSIPSLSQTKSPEGMIQLQGSVYFPSKNSWILGPGMEEKEDKRVVLESIDEKLLSQILQKKVYPFIIRLDKHDAYGFMREWAIVSMPPQRHLGYALQWFAMALVILILFVALNLKKKK
jgi:surfeit locus 1 family protein